MSITAGASPGTLIPITSIRSAATTTPTTKRSTREAAGVHRADAHQVSSTGLTSTGVGRGSRRLTEALRSNSSWSAPSRESSTSARGFERAPFSSSTTPPSSPSTSARATISSGARTSSSISSSGGHTWRTCSRSTRVATEPRSGPRTRLPGSSSRSGT